jgi:hypothetical protein
MSAVHPTKRFYLEFPAAMGAGDGFWSSSVVGHVVRSSRISSLLMNINENQAVAHSFWCGVN